MDQMRTAPCGPSGAHLPHRRLTLTSMLVRLNGSVLVLPDTASAEQAKVYQIQNKDLSEVGSQDTRFRHMFAGGHLPIILDQ